MNNNYNNNLKEIYQIKPNIIEHMDLSMVKSGFKSAGGMVKTGAEQAGAAIKTGAKQAGNVAKNNPGKAALAVAAVAAGAYVASTAIHDTVEINNSQFIISKITLYDSTTSAYKIDFLNPENIDISINDTITLLDTNNNIIGEEYTIIQNNKSNIIVTILDPNFNLTNDNKYFTVNTNIFTQVENSTTDLIKSSGTIAGKVSGAAASGVTNGISNTLDFEISDNIKIIGIVLSLLFLAVLILLGLYYFFIKKS